MKKLNDLEKTNKLFLSKFIQGSVDECWNWTGNKINSGYGVIGYTYRTAHRFSYEFFNGEIKNNLHVLHKCDNKLCVNPNHLFLGTNKDNMQDKAKKGKSYHPNHHGEKNPMFGNGQAVTGSKNGMFGKDRSGNSNGCAKLNLENVNEIRNSNLTNKELAEKFNVGEGYIQAVKDFKTWKIK